MAEAGGGPERWERTLVVVALAVLFFLRVAVLGALPTEHAALPWGHAAAGEATQGLCEPGAQSDGGLPAPERHHHHNCLSCLAKGNAPPFGRCMLSVVTVPLPFTVATALKRPDSIAALVAPLGWMSSWSSRAPPSFS
ncbi:hypothetical+protein [Methylocapsa aurea]